MLQFPKQHVKSNFDRDNGKIEIEYFKGGRTNMAYNCLDRHVKQGRGDQPCFLWEGNELDQSCCMTYKQVLEEVSRLVSSHAMFRYMHKFLHGWNTVSADSVMCDTNPEIYHQSGSFNPEVCKAKC